MADDAHLPPGVSPSTTVIEARRGVQYSAARWTAPDLAALAERLIAGAVALREASAETLLAAWQDAVAELRDPTSPPRRALDPALAELLRLSRPGLSAGLEAVLGGAAGRAAAETFARARGRSDGGLVWVVLAETPPGLAVQPLLPALALRLPVLLESSSAEPLFAPALVRALAARQPAIAEAVAALTWPGGDSDLEAPLVARAERVVAYGGSGTIADLERRVGSRLLDYGPKMSVALVAADADPVATANGLARDVALFDQRGCLSVQAVLVEGASASLAEALSAALAELAVAWPPGPPEPAAAARVHQLRSEARMRGLPVLGEAVAAGTVVVEPGPVTPSPGLRTVRLHPLADLAEAVTRLSPWAGQLQGAALAGGEAWNLAPALRELGVSRLTAPGELQTPDAAWHNGGRDPLEALRTPHPPAVL